MINQKDFTYSSFQDDLTIHATIFIPEGKAIGIVQIVHGMSEHRKRYEPFMKHLSEAGYISVIHDHRGHGDSVKNVNDYGYFYEHTGTFIVEDTHQLTYYMKKTYPNLPYFLFGHSMGSLVVRAYAKKYDYELQGLIVCGSPSHNPMALFGQIVAKTMQFIKGDHYRSAMLHKLIFGSYNKKIANGKSENRWVCSDDTVIEAYDQDDRCGFIFTLNGFENLFRLLRRVYDDEDWLMANKALPILYISGAEDPCIMSEANFRHAHTFSKQLGYENIKAKLYPNMRHEILNETGKLQVYEDVLDFIEAISKA